MCERVCTSAQRVCGGGGVAPQPRGAVWGPSLLSPGVPFSGGSLCTGFRRPCRRLVECVEPIIAGWALLVQTEPSQAVSPPVCALPHLVSSGRLFLGRLFLGRVISKCVVRDRTWYPRAGWNTQQGRIGSPSGKQRTRVFQACCYDFIKAFKPCFPGERQKEKVRLGCMSLASLCTVDRHSRAAPAFLHAVNVRILSHSTASPRPTRLFPVETGGLCGPEDPARQWAVGVRMASCTRRPALCVISPRKMR